MCLLSMLGESDELFMISKKYMRLNNAMKAGWQDVKGSFLIQSRHVKSHHCLRAALRLSPAS